MKKLIEPIKIDLGPKALILPGPEPVLNTEGRVVRVSSPDLSGNELRYVTDAVKTGWISSSGSYIKKFEETFSQAVGVSYGVATTSATTALHLAFFVLGIGEGDEVIVPTFTMAAASNMLHHLKAKSVFVDADPETWTIDVKKIEEKITSKTKAIVAIHIYGHASDMDPIIALAKKHDLWLLEDAAEAHGGEYKGKKVGSLSDVSCFSFYGNKIITTGEGGMLLSDNQEIAEKAQIIRDHGFSKQARFIHEYAAFNFRMTNMQAAIGVAQVERFDQLVEKRRHNAALYNEGLKEISGITTPPEDKNVKNVYWVYGILVDKNFGASRDQLRKALADRGIETRSFFVPIHLQPVFYDSSAPDFPVSEMLCERGLYLPQSSAISDEDIQYVIKNIKEIYGKGR